MDKLTIRDVDVAALQRVVYGKFPTVTVVNIADVMAIIDDVVERIAGLHRIGEPVDVTGAVIFLASPAASLITGTTLLVDGGWTA